MTKLTADSLLAGPRGRRLCLELAGLAAAKDSESPHQSDFGLAMFYASYNLDPGRGQSRVMFGPGAEHPPTPTVDDVAAILDAVPFTAPSEEDLLTALTATVNFARYWQDPDGEDVVAASAPMRHALRRFAQALVDSPLTDWWSSPMDASEQWVITFVDDLPRPPVIGRLTTEILQEWQREVVAEEQEATRNRPAEQTANVSGIWWSRPPSDLIQSIRSWGNRGPVGLHLVEDRFDQEEAFAERLSVPENPRIFEIDSPAAWAQLCRQHPLEVTASKRHDWYRTTGRPGDWVMPDFSALQAMYDGVHLTMGGYLATAGIAIPVDGDHSSVLAGWDPDATFWLRDVGSEVHSRQRWARVQDDPVWSLLGTESRSLTAPARSSWSWSHSDYKGWSGSTCLGTGEELWQRVSDDVLRWEVKTRSGFSVDTPGPVLEGARVNVTARLFGLKVVEPVEVAAVVETPDRVGFAYRTLPGHPVSGEEAFIVERFGDEVHLTIRSLTKAAPQQPWRALFPLLLIAQKVVRKRYLRALR